MIARIKQGADGKKTELFGGLWLFFFVIQSLLNTFYSMYIDPESTCLFITVSLWII